MNEQLAKHIFAFNPLARLMRGKPPETDPYIQHPYTQGSDSTAIEARRKRDEFIEKENQP